MKVLFVSSGNSESFDVSPIIKAQGESLNDLGINVNYYTIDGKGFHGYLKSIVKLRKYIKNNPVDIIHAHYTLSGWVAVLSCSKKPIILSFMGTDINGEYKGVNQIKFSSRLLIILSYLIQPFVKAIICKSSQMKSIVFLNKNLHVIPNGVSLSRFQYKNKNYKDELGLKYNKKYVLFLGGKKRRVKNYKLAEQALSHINSNHISLIAPSMVQHDDVVNYLNSVDVVVVPSLMEGSPNLVKEAMACNCPVVATDVGDISWLFGNEPGYFITGFDPKEMAEKIEEALEFAEKYGRTNGRKRIIQLGLDSETVAKKIMGVYYEELEKK